MDIFATAETKRLYNRELFREVAPRYDLVTRILSFGRDAAWKRALISRLSTKNVNRILDLACGTGDLTRALAARFPDAEVTGLDLTPEMLARAGGTDRIVWKQGDMCDTGLPDGSIDLVTGGYALRNAPDLDTALDEIHRVLRPGGELAVLDFSASSRPLFRSLHYGLLMFWGSLWGLLLHGKPSVYAYIPRSLAQYPDRNTLHRKMNDHGLVVDHASRRMFGMIELLHCRKQG